MLSKIQIKNYKSINECSIDLGQFNVFIGENGSGKSNILEAIAMLSVAKFNNEITTEDLYNKGVRVANPKLTFSSFKGKKQDNKILIDFVTKEDNLLISSRIINNNPDNIYSYWIDDFNNFYKQEIYDLTVNNKYKADIILNNIKERVKYNEIDSFLKNLSDKLQFENFPQVMNFEDLKDFIIYNLETKILRGILKESNKQPLGINGEGLDILISTFDKEEIQKLLKYSYFISWLENFVIDEKDILKFDGHKLGKSTSLIYFRDKFMNKRNNIFSAENANEGVLHILFYLALFISKRTPKFFAIDNIEKSLNPKLCRTLIKELVSISKQNNKQALITTHNPAILDGLNLYDDEQRLFIVSRTDEGYTKVERIKIKPENKDNLKLSEMWMRGYLGGVPNNF
ncbi:MAG: ATP-binding protein [Candidatus Sericytochromatia bacterium]